VVPNRFNGHLDLSNWRRRVWDKAVEATGIKASIYDSRHTFASLLAHEHRSVPFVAAAMGHSSGVTTMKHYMHEFERARLETAKPMADAITDARANVGMRRRGVRNVYAQAEPRRLRQAAPRAATGSTEP
jgi:hypothetical protein